MLVAVGLSVLSTVGRLYIDFSARRPAYQLVGGTVALLLFLYLFNQLLLYGAALAATSKHGTVVDLAAGAPPADDGDESEGTDDRQPSDTATRDARAEGDTTPPIGAARDDDRSMNGSRVTPLLATPLRTGEPTRHRRRPPRTVRRPPAATRPASRPTAGRGPRTRIGRLHDRPADVAGLTIAAGKRPKATFARFPPADTARRRPHATMMDMWARS